MGGGAPAVEVARDGDGFGIGGAVAELDEGGGEVADGAVVELDEVSGGIGHADDAVVAVEGVLVEEVMLVVLAEGLESGPATRVRVLDEFEAAAVGTPKAVALGGGIGDLFDSILGAGVRRHVEGVGGGVGEGPVVAVGIVDLDHFVAFAVEAAVVDGPEVVVAPVAGGSHGHGESAVVAAGAEAAKFEGAPADGGGQFEIGDLAPDVSAKGVEEVGATSLAAGRRWTVAPDVAAGLGNKEDGEERECGQAESDACFHFCFHFWIGARMRKRVYGLESCGEDSEAVGIECGMAGGHPEMEDFLAGAGAQEDFVAAGVFGR